VSMSHSRVEEYIAQLQSMTLLGDESKPGSVASMSAYYRSRPRGKRLAFRTASVTLITLSASLPLVAAFGDEVRCCGWQLNTKIALGLMSAAIALVTGLLGHFRWEVAWRGQTEALFAMNAEKAAWEAAIAFARTHPDEAAAVKFLNESYEQFRVRVHDIVRGEIGEFFRVTQAPSIKPPTTT